MDERERLLKVIEVEGMTSKQFAEEVGIGAGTLSNIAGGRNNPSLEVMQKVLQRFRNINAQWLILGTGTMYASNPTIEPELFSTEVSTLGVSSPMGTHTNGSSTGTIAGSGASSSVGNAEVRRTTNEQPLPVVETVVREVSKKIQKIVIFYTDGTFEER